MNILIVTPHFYPENFKINDFANGFAAKGHNISVLTAVPDYPGGKFYKGYGILKKNREIINSIKIYRAPLIPRGSGSSIRLVMNYLSFVIGAVFTSLFMVKNKYDLIFVYEPSPITIGIPAIVLKKIKKIPMLFWVQDLWPESIAAASKLKSKNIQKILTPLVKFIYNNSDLIMVSSRGFVRSIQSKNILSSKIHYLPNWAEDIFKPVEQASLTIKQIPSNSFIIMFAGNIGDAQDFKSILSAANTLKWNKHIHWVILGNGRKKKWVEKEILKFGLSLNFHLLGSFPLAKMPEYYSIADAMLISLKKEYIFSLTVPAKVQTYLACGKPILAMMDGEGAQIIRDSKSGFVCTAECPDDLVANILKMTKLTKKQMDIFGKNSLKFYNENFDRQLILDKVENLFHKFIT